MDFISVILIWILYATFCACVTHAIAIFINKKINSDYPMIHWFNWVLLPIWILFLFVASSFVSVIEDDSDVKIGVIKKMWLTFFKNLM
jgi:hypothetical protein